MSAKKNYEAYLYDSVLADKIRAGQNVLYDEDKQVLENYVKDVYDSAKASGSISLRDFLIYVDFLDTVRMAGDGDLAEVCEKAFITNANFMSLIDEE